MMIVSSYTFSRDNFYKMTKPSFCSYLGAHYSHAIGTVPQILITQLSKLLQSFFIIENVTRQLYGFQNLDSKLLSLSFASLSLCFCYLSLVVIFTLVVIVVSVDIIDHYREAFIFVVLRRSMRWLSGRANAQWVETMESTHKFHKLKATLP